MSHVTTILNAIDLDTFFPSPPAGALRRSLAIQGDDLIVVHLSNLTALKRPLDIVYSAERALREQPRLLYLVVGDGAMRAPMEEACRARQIADRFRFVGWVEYERIPDYINLADIVVMPSEGEGLARVYLERQACARVLLASDIPAAREVVLDGVTGLLFRKGDIDDLTAKTLMAATQPAVRKRHRPKRARARAVRHGLPAAVRAYASTLQELVAQRRRGADCGRPNGT